MSTTPSDTKPAWTRCDRCKQRLWNDRIDIEVHRAVCPADMARTIRNLGKALEKVEGRVKELESRPVAHVVEVEAGPSLDFEHEAPWPGDAQAGPEDDEDPLPEVPDAAPILQTPNSTGTGRASYFGDDDDDEEDLIRTSVR